MKSLAFFHDLKNQVHPASAGPDSLRLAWQFLESLAPKLKESQRAHWSVLFVDEPYESRVLHCMRAMATDGDPSCTSCVRDFAIRFNRVGASVRDAAWPHVNLLCYGPPSIPPPEVDVLVFAASERVGRAASRLIATATGKLVQPTTDPRTVGAFQHEGRALILMSAPHGYCSVRAFLDFEARPHRTIDPFEAGSLEQACNAVAIP